MKDDKVYYYITLCTKDGAPSLWREGTAADLAPGAEIPVSGAGAAVAAAIGGVSAKFAQVTPDPAKRAISLSIGEPRHPTPRLIVDALRAAEGSLANYPTTIGAPALREAIAGWLVRRHGLPALDPATLEVKKVDGRSF